MEQVYPAVLEWNLNVQSVDFDDATGSFAATTRARIVGGDVLSGNAQASDPLGAVRLAFNHSTARERASSCSDSSAVSS
jgi:hypothetical protein